MAIFMAKTTPRWLGCSRLDRPTWNVSSGSYHTQMHGGVCLLGSFFPIPGTYPGLQGSKNGNASSFEKSCRMHAYMVLHVPDMSIEE